ncbi:MAG: ABC transporter permease [Planctomycetes bacterium]|nr:ABC transporter permease [Planctomycetota bacterium]
MKTYILQRLGLILPNLIGITFISYGIMMLAPGDPAALIMGTGVAGQMGRRGPTKEDLARLRHEYGLDQPWYRRYGSWLSRVATLDFGKSMNPKDRRPVWELIRQALPITLVLNFWSLLLIYLVGLPIGIYSASRQYTWLDRTLTIALFVLYSLPSFWVATNCLLLLCGGDYLRLFPITAMTEQCCADREGFGALLHRGWHLFLPVAVLTYASFAFTSRQMRVGMLEQIRQDYVRTSRAKGLSERMVILKHALRNSLIPVVTLFGDLLPALLGGSVIVEQIFSVPGMGRLDFEAITQKNFTVVMGITTISALLTLVGILISDLLYVAVNPKIRFD